MGYDILKAVCPVRRDYLIIACGEAIIDFIPGGGAEPSYLPRPGGSLFNLAVASARLGAPTGFLGCISRDFFGDMLMDRLHAEGVDDAFIRRSERLSTLAFVKIAQGEEPRYAFFTENSADRGLCIEDIPPVLPDSVECLAFGSISLLLEPGASAVTALIRREASPRAVSLDPNVRPMLVRRKASYRLQLEGLLGPAGIVKVSSADLEWLYPGRSALESADEWRERCGGIVVMTRGRDGALFLGPNFRVEVSGSCVAVKDTIGAGDTFHAALLVHLRRLGRLNPQCAAELTEPEARDVLSFAVKAASLNCTRVGADPPTAAEMETASLRNPD